MKNVFRNKDGQLSRYAFACGYIQQKEDKTKTVSLYQDGCFHVRANDGCLRLLWDCYDNLTEARKAYAKAKRDVFA